jgi:hypothetical protein
MCVPSSDSDSGWAALQTLEKEIVLAEHAEIAETGDRRSETRLRSSYSLHDLRVFARYILFRLQTLRCLRALRESPYDSSDEPLPERRAVRVEDMRRTRRRELVSVSWGAGTEFASVWR